MEKVEYRATQKVEKIVLEDARVKKKQVAEMVGVSDTTIFKILHDHLSMSRSAQDGCRECSRRRKNNSA